MAKKQLNINIKKNIQAFIKGKGRDKGRKPDERYASFDYCFNYFQGFKNNPKKLASSKNMIKSCLHLAFYLASWGMFRGSTFLLTKSFRFFRRLTLVISKYDKKIWQLDVNNYNNEGSLNLIMKCKKEIIKALDEKNSATDTLVSKIMLGIFGNVPAFDQYFRRGLKAYHFNKHSLRKIHKYYLAHKNIIDSYTILTFDFQSGKNTKIKYTKAKIIDMIGFIEGQN